MKKYSYAYVLGIGGIGMSALARWLLREGVQVFGHDMAKTSLTDQLEKEGISIHFEVSTHAIPRPILDNVDDTIVAYTPSISPQKHIILQYLLEHGYKVCKRADFLGLVTKDHYTLAVAGTHGKTTSTSLAAHILCHANTNVAAFLGGIAKNYHSNFIASDNTEKETTVVIEADEFDRFFLCLHPDMAIVTTVDPDHLEIYGDTNGFEEGFRQFLARLPEHGVAVLHRSVTKKLLGSSYPTQARVLQYALTDAPIYADNLYIDQLGRFCFNYVSEATIIKDIHLPVPGRHNVENALAVITACLCMGIDPSVIREAIHTFQGVTRRFDRIIECNGIVLLDDYGHHPVEITALISTIRQLYLGKKITIVFRPNQYSRTKDFLYEIAASLSLADHVFILDIYSDREDPIEGINSEAILQHVSLPFKYACTRDNLLTYLHQCYQAEKPEIIVNLGAGDADDFIQPIKEFLLQHYC